MHLRARTAEAQYAEVHLVRRKSLGYAGRRISLQPKLEAGGQEPPAGLQHVIHWVVGHWGPCLQPAGSGLQDITQVKLMAEQIRALPD